MKYLFTFLSMLLVIKCEAQTKVNSNSLKNHIGDSVIVCDKIYEAKYLDKSQLTLFYVGNNFPNHLFSVIIKKEDRSKFKVRPELVFKDKKVCITGRVVEYAALPQIIITDPSQIKLE